MSKLPKGLVARSVELLKLAAKVGSEEVFSHSDNPVTRQVEQAKSLVDSLGKLKGAAMKVGQLLSMDFSDLFPPEVRQVLEQLQSSSPHFMSEAEVKEILEKELHQKNSQPTNDQPSSVDLPNGKTWFSVSLVVNQSSP